MRFFFSLAFLFAITFNVYGQVPDYVPSEGLAAWYPLNGNATDLIGGNNGVLFGNSASDNRFGEPGGALGFDGDNDYVSLDTFFGGSQVVSASYSLWFNSHGSVNTQHISGKDVGLGW